MLQETISSRSSCEFVQEWNERAALFVKHGILHNVQPGVWANRTKEMLRIKTSLTPTGVFLQTAVNLLPDYW